MDHTKSYLMKLNKEDSVRLLVLYYQGKLNSILDDLKNNFDELVYDCLFLCNLVAYPFSTFLIMPKLSHFLAIILHWLMNYLWNHNCCKILVII